MAFKLTVQDQLPIGKVTNTLVFEVGTEKLTVRELIRKRVFEEVTMYNLSKPGYFKGLVQPSNAEQTLNGYKLRQHREINWEKQAEKAMNAFQSNGFFILVDDHQVENLDDVIQVKDGTEISFVRLVPLVGG